MSKSSFPSRPTNANLMEKKARNQCSFVTNDCVHQRDTRRKTVCTAYIWFVALIKKRTSEWPHVSEQCSTDGVNATEICKNLSAIRIEKAAMFQVPWILLQASSVGTVTAEWLRRVIHLTARYVHESELDWNIWSTLRPMHRLPLKVVA
jgi:hypothetical protein